MTTHHITVPASSANLGPGFDCLGMALNIVDEVTVDLDPGRGETCLEGSDHFGLDRRDNLICRAYGAYALDAGVELPAATFHLESHIPVGKGFGSSAASIVAGLVAAATAAGSQLDAAEVRDRLLRLAATLEGHADNTTAALLGGVTLALREGDGVRALTVVNHLTIGVVLFVPNDTLQTSDARRSLPAQVPHADAAFNASRTAYLVTALLWGRWEELGFGMEDRLHQHYREPLIPALPAVIGAARESGAYGAALSGGGPSVIALCPPERAVEVAGGMAQRARTEGWSGETIETTVRHLGVQVKTQT
jgi:homoserine kinase